MRWTQFSSITSLGLTNVIRPLCARFSGFVDGSLLPDAPAAIFTHKQIVAKYEDLRVQKNRNTIVAEKENNGMESSGNRIGIIGGETAELKSFAVLLNRVYLFEQDESLDKKIALVQRFHLKNLLNCLWCFSDEWRDILDEKARIHWERITGKVASVRKVLVVAEFCEKESFGLERLDRLISKFGLLRGHQVVGDLKIKCVANVATFGLTLCWKLHEYQMELPTLRPFHILVHEFETSV